MKKKDKKILIKLISIYIIVIALPQILYGFIVGILEEMGIPKELLFLHLLEDLHPLLASYIMIAVILITLFLLKFIIRKFLKNRKYNNKTYNKNYSKSKTSKRTPISKSKRFKVLKRDNYTCQYCGRSAPEVKLEIDHQKPVSKGGTNDINNLVTSCRSCNRGKSDKFP